MEYLKFSLVFLSFFLFWNIFRNKSGTPTNWPLVGMLLPLLRNVNRIHDWVSEILETSQLSFLFKGPWFTNMEMLVTVDPANIHHIMTKNFSNYPKGTKFNEIFDVMGDGIFNVDFDLWKYHRSMAHTFIAHPRFRHFLVVKIQEKVEKGLIPVLDHAANERLVVDLQDIFARFTFDNICTLVMGHDVGSLSIDWPHVPFSKALDDVEEVILYRHVVPMSVWKILRWLRIGKERKYKRAWEILDEFIYKCIAKKRAELGKNEGVGVDLLTLYMDKSQNVNVKDASDKFLRDTILSYFIAGRDTTSLALSWFFYLLIKNPRVVSKIRDELEKKMTKIDDFNNLVYLHGALCEALRLYPPVVFQAKGPTKPDTLPSGHEVNPNMQIIFSMYAMARMKSIWGNDCYEFKPERWISESGKIRHEPSYKYLVFNAGPRTCLGKDMAFTQMKVVAATIVKNYEFQALEGHLVVPDISIMLRVKYGLKVQVSKS